MSNNSNNKVNQQGQIEKLNVDVTMYGSDLTLHKQVRAKINEIIDVLNKPSETTKEQPDNEWRCPFGCNCQSLDDCDMG